MTGVKSMFVEFGGKENNWGQLLPAVQIIREVPVHDW